MQLFYVASNKYSLNQPQQNKKTHTYSKQITYICIPILAKE